MKRQKKPSRVTPLPAPVDEFAVYLKQQHQLWDEMTKRFAASELTVAGDNPIDPFLLEPVVDKLLSEPPQLVSREFLDLRNWLVTEKAKVASQFEQRLRAFCESRRLTVEGRYPSYCVAEFVTIEVRPVSNECLIDDKRVPSLMFESSIARLEEALAALNERETPPEALLEQLFSACRRAVAIDGTLASDGIPIKIVFRELLFVRQESGFFKNPTRSNYREYTLKAFSRDLSRLMKSGRMETQNGHRVSFGPTSTADGVAILYEGAARNIGRVGFTKGDR